MTNQEIYQYRFGTDNDNITAQELEAGIAKIPICQLSIETLPGMEFLINGVNEIIGVTGIYELTLDSISNLALSSKSSAILQEGIQKCAEQKIQNTQYKLLINIVRNI